MVFVTGASGLLGAYLLRELLNRGETVKALYRTRKPSLLSVAELEAIEWVRGDLFDVVLLSTLCRECSEVYHVAGLVSFNPRRKQDLMRVNVQGTANVVNACLEGGVRKMVHVSSVSALGRRRDGVTVREDAKWSEENNLSTYGKSKYLAEMEVWRGISEGLNAVIVNPTIILGVSDWGDGSAAIFRKAYSEFPWYTPGSSGFVDAGDVARAMVELMRSPVNAERFIISAENRTFREIFILMARNFGKKEPRLKASPFMAALVWRLERIRSIFTTEEPLLTKETAETARIKVYYDNSKLKNFLPGFSYKPLEETIAQSCSEYLLRVNT